MDMDKIEAATTITVVIAATRNWRKIIKDRIIKRIDDMVAINGPLLKVNNRAENCNNRVTHHITIIIAKLLPKPWLIRMVYKCPDEKATVTTVVRSRREPAITGFPVVSAARE